METVWMGNCVKGSHWKTESCEGRETKNKFANGVQWKSIEKEVLDMEEKESGAC